MKKHRISINYQDGENHLDEGIGIPDNSYAGSKMGQYAVMEVEVDQCLKDEETELFRKTLKKVHSIYVEEEKEIYKPKIKPVYSRIYIYAAVASIALVVGIFGILYFTSGSSKSGYQKIFAQYYEPYQNEYITRSDHSSVNNLYVAFNAYEDHDYRKAIELFNKVIEADKSLLIAFFYKGISCIEIKNYNLAVESLGTILKNENNPYYVQSRWYTALTMLNLNKPDIAKQHLEWLVLNDRYYGNKAKEILKVLDK